MNLKHLTLTIALISSTILHSASSAASSATAAAGAGDGASSGAHVHSQEATIPFSGMFIENRLIEFPKRKIYARLNFELPDSMIAGVEDVFKKLEETRKKRVPRAKRLFLRSEAADAPIEVHPAEDFHISLIDGIAAKHRFTKLLDTLFSSSVKDKLAVDDHMRKLDNSAGGNALESLYSCYKKQMFLTKKDSLTINEFFKKLCLKNMEGNEFVWLRLDGKVIKSYYSLLGVSIEDTVVQQVAVEGGQFLDPFIAFMDEYFYGLPRGFDHFLAIARKEGKFDDLVKYINDISGKNLTAFDITDKLYRSCPRNIRDYENFKDCVKRSLYGLIGNPYPIREMLDFCIDPIRPIILQMTLNARQFFADNPLSMGCGALMYYSPWNGNVHSNVVYQLNIRYAGELLSAIYGNGELIRSIKSLYYTEEDFEKSKIGKIYDFILEYMQLRDILDSAGSSSEEKRKAKSLLSKAYKKTESKLHMTLVKIRNGFLNLPDDAYKGRFEENLRRTFEQAIACTA